MIDVQVGNHLAIIVKS